MPGDLSETGNIHQANRLLATASATDLAALLPLLEVVPLASRTVLADAGQPIRHLYFPHSAVLCLATVTREGRVVETATIGSEGVAGFDTLLGKPTATHRLFVQVPGIASRIRAGELAAAMRMRASLRALLLRYIAAFICQVTQSVVCNVQHELEARCARWLLTAHDRAGRDRLNLTQELLSQMLGVRRPTLSIAARGLQAAGLIQYRRGVLTILDRDGMEAAACECYGIVKRAFEEFLAG